MNPRKKPGVAFWAIVVVVVVLVAYPLSVGPVQRAALANLESLPDWAILAVGWYSTPLVWLGQNGPEWLQLAISRYFVFWLT